MSNNRKGLFMTYMKLSLSILFAGSLYIGCSSDDSASTVATSKITGTVPGTLIEAFCSDGSYYYVNSTDNNTSEHPFELEIPQTVNCRLVMTTNEDNVSTKVVTPIGIATSDGNTTLFTASSELIDLGYVDLEMDRSAIVDSNGDGVCDQVLTVTLSNNEVINVTLSDDPMDKDGDGILNVYEDDDDDGLCNHDDDDDDGDGTLDSVDYDQDNDGVNDNDHDGDGITNDQDSDIDNDSIGNTEDSDDDNDGIDDDIDSDDDNDGVDDDNDDDEEEDDSDEDDEIDD